MGLALGEYLQLDIDTCLLVSSCRKNDAQQAEHLNLVMTLELISTMLCQTERRCNNEDQSMNFEYNMLMMDYGPQAGHLNLAMMLEHISKLQFPTEERFRTM
jgi:hypothetical protein